MEVPEGEEGAVNVAPDIGMAPEGAVTNRGVCNGQEDVINIAPDAMNVLCNGEGAMNVPGDVPEGECMRGWSREQGEKDTMNVAPAIGSALKGERVRGEACQGEGTMNIVLDVGIAPDGEGARGGARNGKEDTMYVRQDVGSAPEGERCTRGGAHDGKRRRMNVAEGSVWKSRESVQVEGDVAQEGRSMTLCRSLHTRIGSFLAHLPQSPSHAESSLSHQAQFGPNELETSCESPSHQVNLELSPNELDQEIENGKTTNPNSNSCAAEEAEKIFNMLLN